MKSLFDAVSYECSKTVTVRYSTSFSMAVKMLDPKIQNPIYGIYGFVRLADEIVDSFHDFDKEDLLNEFEDNVKKACSRRISLNPILNSFQDVIHTYNVDYSFVEAFLRSMRMDLQKQTYTQSEYEEYIYGSADVVGLICLKVFVNGDQKEFERLRPAASKLGIAFQKVNFLRDFKDDTGLLKRHYFPHLKEQGLNTASKSSIIAEIEQDFEEATKGIHQLPVEAKLGVYTAYIYYKKLLQKLKNSSVEKIKKNRIRVSDSVKMGLLAKSFIKFKLNLI